MKIVVKYAILTIILALTIAYSVRYLTFLTRLLKDPGPIFYFICGIVLFLILKITYLKHNLRFLRTFNHETHHLVFSILSLNKMSSFNVHSMGAGNVEYHGKGSILISLAPYSISLPLIFLLSLVLVWPRMNTPAMDVLLGFVLYFHLETTYIDCRPYQTDLKKTGLVYSYILIICLNLLMIFYTTVFCYYSHNAGWNFLKGGFRETISFIGQLANIIS